MAINQTMQTVPKAVVSGERSLRNQLLAGVAVAAVAGGTMFTYFFSQARQQQLTGELSAAVTEQWSQISTSFALSSLAVPDLVANKQVKLPTAALNNQGFLAIASDKEELLLYSLEPDRVTPENVSQLPKIDDQPLLRSGFETWKTGTYDRVNLIQVGGDLLAYRRITEKSEWFVIAAVPAAQIWLETIGLGIAVVIVVGAIGFVTVKLVVDSLDPTLDLIVSESKQLLQAETVGQGSKLVQAKLGFEQLVSKILADQERIRVEVTQAVEQRERDRRNRETEAEDNAIQKEVSALLDVVSALEEGNLTIQAEVSDRATGLVADTLNRLTEQLANIIAKVLQTSQEVASGSSELEQMAKVVAQNTVDQAKSVAKGEALTEQVANAAQTSTVLVKEASQSLVQVLERVIDGQDAILKLSRNIEVLQKSTGQIVQRMKTLGEFVGLAEQFVQDQGQLASLTQVLAINATLVAARAAEQRDPRQFVGVAREFEAIAGQVNTLATQTNEGLSVLQQRTAQIQSVVSSVDGEIQQLDNLVESLGTSVQRSRSAFEEVQLKTEQVVESSEQVSQSSSEIAKAAASTAEYMGEIAKIAAKTAVLTRSTKAQAETMGIIAQELLDGINFFRLPPNLKLAPRSTPRNLAAVADYERQLEAELQTLVETRSGIQPRMKPEELFGNSLPIQSQLKESSPAFALEEPEHPEPALTEDHTKDHNQVTDFRDGSDSATTSMPEDFTEDEFDFNADLQAFLATDEAMETTVVDTDFNAYLTETESAPIV
ncbi:MAG: methyl-accepting chemotaxis protein [Pseudanabaenaceae cyanobacterium bins.68]|nr:methyl-accepting chemotaxis protein [Pseudanabaenaceae cyanobacterium bins.68]